MQARSGNLIYFNTFVKKKHRTEKKALQPLHFAPFFVRDSPSAEKWEFSRHFYKFLIVSLFLFLANLQNSTPRAERFVRPGGTVRSAVSEDSLEHARRFVWRRRRTIFGATSCDASSPGQFFSLHATPSAIHLQALVCDFHLSKKNSI